MYIVILFCLWVISTVICTYTSQLSGMLAIEMHDKHPGPQWQFGLIVLQKFLSVLSWRILCVNYPTSHFPMRPFYTQGNYCKLHIATAVLRLKARYFNSPLIRQLWLPSNYPATLSTLFVYLLICDFVTVRWSCSI